MSVGPNFGVFPLGTHVYREPYQDQDELLADLPILQKLGFNMIKIQESWAIDEPAEGEFDFSRIERIITRAGELGLGIYLGLTMEQVPAWMWQKYPDCHLVYANGQPHNDPTQYLLPADGKPGPCWDHPGARAAGERFVAELARRLGQFDNIWAWNTWQEIGFWPNEGGPLGFCYCPHTLARFREWLKEKYGDLGSLNATWYTAYTDWEAIEPPRRSPFNPPYIDWRYFMDDVYLVRALEWKTQALKAHDPKGRPVFSHVASPRIGAGAEWRWARAGDFFGNSNYPAWSSFHDWDDLAADRSAWHPSAYQELWNSVMLRADYVRSATGRGRTFWGAEFQGGPVSTHLHLGRTPRAADIQRWMLAGLAAGMHGISFWNNRAERSWQECNGFGLLDPRGETTERIEEASRIGRAVNQEWQLFALGEPPRAQVAILINEDLYHFCEGSQTNALGLLTYNVRGHYARLWRLGIPVDFVNESDVANGALTEYRAAILPFPIALGDDYFAYLRRYVETGGLLISDACPGRFDKYGFCPRAQLVGGAEEVFGAEHASVQVVREPDGQTRWTPTERGFGEFADEAVLTGAGAYADYQLRASFYLQTLTPRGAESILTVGDAVAGVMNRFGQGTAVLLGTFAGIGATAHTDSDGDAFFERLLRQEASVEPDRCGRLLRRRRVFDDREAWFLINPTDQEVTEAVPVDNLTGIRDLFDEPIIVSDQGTMQVTVQPAGIRCLVGSH